MASTNGSEQRFKHVDHMGGSSPIKGAVVGIRCELCCLSIIGATFGALHGAGIPNGGHGDTPSPEANFLPEPFYCPRYDPVRDEETIGDISGR